MVESIPFARGIQRLTQWRPNSQWYERPAGLHHWRSLDAVNEVLVISATGTTLPMVEPRLGADVLPGYIISAPGTVDEVLATSDTVTVDLLMLEPWQGLVRKTSSAVWRATSSPRPVWSVRDGRARPVPKSQSLGSPQ